MKKSFMIKYFEKCLDNELSPDTENWIEQNWERLDLEEEPIHHLWNEYLESFSEKHNLGQWHKVMPYRDLYRIYIDIGFSHTKADFYAHHVRRLMEEYEADPETFSMGWGHQRNIFYWFPSCFCYERKDTYDIEDYHLG